VLLLCGMLAGNALAETQKAPAVSKNPAAKTVDEPAGATFEAAATGTPTPTVQWERSTDGGASFNPIAGATSGKYTVEATSTTETGYQFRAVFRNTAGEALTKAAALTVERAPYVTRQPESRIAEPGTTAAFEAAGAGSPSPSVQWERSVNGGTSWVSLGAAATADRLEVAGVKTSESGYEYRASFKNTLGSAKSEPATLTVREAPSVKAEPRNAEADEGSSASFEATASGFPAPAVQWEVSTDLGLDWSPLLGDTADKLTIAAAGGSESGDEFRAVFSNAAGQAISSPATLTVHSPPVIGQQPRSITVEAGQEAVFDASSSGFPEPTVQWEISTDGGLAWSEVSGAGSDELRIAAAVAGEGGDEFRALFTNAAGQARTAAATLTVATNHYSAVSWGDNVFRELGDGGAESLSDAPVPVRGLRFVTAVAAGGRHSLALLANGTVEAWGDDEFGQLGNGGFLTSSVPVAVSGLSGVTEIAAGSSHSLALLGDGKVMAWGDNESGQLGDGSTTESATPVEVKGLSSKVKAIAAGGEESMALLENGTVVAWGQGESGQLGDGALVFRTSPVAVKGLTDVSAIAVGGEFALALSRGAVEAWGSDEWGELANGSVEEELSDVPVPVEGLSGVTAIAAGATHALAILTSRTVMAWGQDAEGELGNGSTAAEHAQPVAVSGLTGAVGISAGSQTSVAMREGGGLVAWGANRLGTLGDGRTGEGSDLPVAITGISKVASVSAGGSHMVAFGEPVPAVSAVSPDQGPRAGGNTVRITGENLGEASAVRFGTVAATSFNVESATEITAVAPAGTGTANVTVSTADGTSAAIPAARYTYLPAPAVTKLSVKTGPAKGGTEVLVTGTEFVGVSAVSFNGAPAAYTVTSPTTIRVTSPAGAAGVANVTVTGAGGTSATSAKDYFTYKPSVEAVSPESGSQGTVVTVTGSGFALGATATAFKFGTGKAISVSCTSTTTCTMAAPKGTGTVNVVATVNKEASPANAPDDDFTY